MHWHLQRLVEAGLVREEKLPRECRYRPTELGQELTPLPGPAAGVPSPMLPGAALGAVSGHFR